MYLPMPLFWLDYLFIFKEFFYLFLEKGAERDKERERNIDRLPPARAPDEDEPHNAATPPLVG